MNESNHLQIYYNTEGLFAGLFNISTPFTDQNRFVKGVEISIILLTLFDDIESIFGVIVSKILHQ